MFVVMLGLALVAQASFEQPWVGVRNASLRESRTTIFTQGALRGSFFEIARSYNPLSQLERNVIDFADGMENHYFKIGLDSIGFNDFGSELSYHEQTLSLTRAFEGKYGFHYGGSLKFYNINTVKSGNGVSIGLGLQKEFGNTKVILEANNIFNRISYATGRVETHANKFNLLFESSPFLGSTFYLKFDDLGNNNSCKVGVEYILSPELVSRFGFDGSGWAGGIEVFRNKLTIGYTLLNNSLGVEHVVALGYLY